MLVPNLNKNACTNLPFWFFKSTLLTKEHVSSLPLCFVFSSPPPSTSSHPPKYHHVKTWTFGFGPSSKNDASAFVTKKVSLPWTHSLLVASPDLHNVSVCVFPLEIRMELVLSKRSNKNGAPKKCFTLQCRLGCVFFSRAAENDRYWRGALGHPSLTLLVRRKGSLLLCFVMIS